MKLTLRYDIRRMSCPNCQAVKVERVPWAETGSWFTSPFEDHVAYPAQRCDQTTASSSMRIAWQTVDAIVQRVVARRREGDPLATPLHPFLWGSSALQPSSIEIRGCVSDFEGAVA